jgi:hypothetical protein
LEGGEHSNSYPSLKDLSFSRQSHGYEDIRVTFDDAVRISDPELAASRFTSILGSCGLPTSMYVSRTYLFIIKCYCVVFESLAVSMATWTQSVQRSNSTDAKMSISRAVCDACDRLRDSNDAANFATHDANIAAIIITYLGDERGVSMLYILPRLHHGCGYPYVFDASWAMPNT